MTYEEEQIQYAKELKEVNIAIKKFDELFCEPYLVDEKITELYKQLHPQIDPLELNFSSISINRVNINLFKQSLESEYQKKKTRKKALERLLAQTPAERRKENITNNIWETAEFLTSIAPQHVSGRIYKVENKDGCGIFCLWFIIIDAIIVLLFFLFNN